MKSFLSIKGLKKTEIERIFEIADNIEVYKDILSSKTIVTFFSDTSVRTRISFETAIRRLGGNVVQFPSSALDKGEPMKDIAGYVDNWCDGIVVRHSSDELIKQLAESTSAYVINAMSKQAHPCEILSDLYAFKKLGIDINGDTFVFIGPRGNIGHSYYEASKILGYKFVQVCIKGDEISGADIAYEIDDVIGSAEVILADSLGEAQRETYKKFIIDEKMLSKAKDSVLVNPCPPLHRGYEVSDAVINSKYFVGYEFKATLETIQAAILVFLEKSKDEEKYALSYH